MTLNRHSLRLRPISVVAAITGASFLLVASCSDSPAKAKPNYVFKDPAKPGVLAKVLGEEITEEILSADAKAEFFEIRKREYDLRMEALNRLVENRILTAEAKKANLPLAEYVEKKIVGGDIKVEDKDFKKFIAERKWNESQIQPEMKEKIFEFLKGSKRQEKVMAHVAKITKSNPAEVFFKKPRMNMQVDVGQAPVMGGAKAPVTIIEFSDFQCPYCSRAAETITQVKKAYGSKVRVAFKHFPLPMHREAIPASEASMCVNEQSTDKFWKFHDLVFKNQGQLDNASLEKYAKEAGADTKKFSECFQAGKYRGFVQGDMQQGEKVGVRSTPAFFVNGQLVSGALPFDSFKEVIDEELAAAKE